MFPAGLEKKKCTLSALGRLCKQSLLAAVVISQFMLPPMHAIASNHMAPPEKTAPVATPAPVSSAKKDPKAAGKSTTKKAPSSSAGKISAKPLKPDTGLPAYYQKSAPLKPLDKDALAKARRAFAAAREGAWSLAREQARASGDPMVIKLIRWANMARPATNASYGELANFVRENPDWPQQDDLERNTEDNLPADLSDQNIIDWFRQYPPHTFEGTRRYARALINRGDETKARAEIRARWINGPVPSIQQGDFLQEFHQYLTRADHRDRLDRLILDEHYDAAESMLKFVGDDYRALGEARIALGTRSPGVDGAVSRVPAKLINDPGLILERIRWRRRNSLDMDAATLLASVSPAASRDDVWWNERQIIARKMLDAGNIKVAYRIVAHHGHVSGLTAASAEWMAGWLSLRYLNDPATALRHFQAMVKNVETPISLARAYYWAGRAAQSAGQKDLAVEYFQHAARYKSTFYGMLSNTRLNAKPVLNLASDERNENDRSDQLLASTEMWQAASRLVEIGGPALYYANYFMIRLRNDLTGARAFGMLGRLALKSGQIAESVKIGKEAINDRNILLPEIAYPVRNTLPTAPEPALIHAIIRQESLFNPSVRSPVGAMGLMQLMPDTARAMAKTEGLRHSTDMLVRHPEHNVKLGSAYLQSLVRRYDGAYILAIAAYNAGPSRVNSWIASFGDPRSRNIDPIDWIERIPYNETRNYVHRVMENLQMYRARLHHNQAALDIDADLRRGRIQAE